MGASPQVLLNRQLVEYCDILVGVFWSRIGTKTEAAESGTAEEIEQFIKSGKPVMLYFSLASIPQRKLDTKQYERLQDFKQKCKDGGLINEYDGTASLREKLSGHLTKTVRQACGPDKLSPEKKDKPSVKVIKGDSNSSILRLSLDAFEKVVDEELQILLLLAKREEAGEEEVKESYILSKLNSPRTKTKFYLEKLAGDKYISWLQNYVFGNSYKLSFKGRSYLIKNGLIPDKK